MATSISNAILFKMRRFTMAVYSLSASPTVFGRAAILSTSTSISRPELQFKQQNRSLTGSKHLMNATKDAEQLEQKQSITSDKDPYKLEAEKCILCQHQIPVSYKNVQLLSQFVSPNTGRILSQTVTRLCNAQQQRVSKAIKRAVQMGFMPNQYRETRFLKDPSLYSIKYTGSPVIGQYSKLPDSNVSQEELLESQQSGDSKATSKS